MRATIDRSQLENPEAAVGEVTTAEVNETTQAVVVLAISGEQVEVDTNLDAPAYEG